MGIETAIGAALISGAATGVTSLASTAMTNDANADLAKSANQTQIELANTAHQREVADLKAAGLNPILSAGGSGSSTPVMHVPTLANPGEGLAKAMSEGITNYSALQSSKQYDPLVDKMRSEKSLNDALTLKAAADTSSALSNARNTEEQTRVLRGGAGAKLLGTSLFSNSHEKISDKVNSVIDGITVSSAKKVSTPSPYKPFHDVTKPRPFNSGSRLKSPLGSIFNYQ